MEIWTAVGQYGVPAVITIYIVYWLTQRVEKILVKLQEAINNQTETLNHSLTELITQITKGFNNQLTIDKAKKLIKNKKCKR